MTSLKSTLTLCAALLVTSSAFAGERIMASSKESKSTITETPCFAEHEFQLDIFGQYIVNDSDKLGLFRDHAWGGGVGLNYFLTRNLGIGIDAAWMYGFESGIMATTPDDYHRKHTMHLFSGSVIYRFPIDEKCLAPYVYGGGGVAVDGEQWGTAHVGAGLEYRFVPQRVGFFVDGRWTFLGDRRGHDDLNFYSTRAGFRIIF